MESITWVKAEVCHSDCIKDAEESGRELGERLRHIKSEIKIYNIGTFRIAAWI